MARGASHGRKFNLYYSSMSRGHSGDGRLACLAADACQVKRRPDFVVLAQRYADCAFVHITRGEQAINEKERLYHAATAGEYLLLAKGELRAARARRHRRLRRSVLPTRERP